MHKNATLATKWRHAFFNTKPKQVSSKGISIEVP